MASTCHSGVRLHDACQPTNTHQTRVACLNAPPKMHHSATCMGFELLNVLVGGVPVLTAGFNSENLTLPLDLTPYAAEARMLANAPQVVNIVKTQAVTMNNHHSGNNC